MSLRFVRRYLNSRGHTQCTIKLRYGHEGRIGSFLWSRRSWYIWTIRKETWRGTNSNPERQNFSPEAYQRYTLLCTKMRCRQIKWINQPDAAISQVYYLSFKYSSTCFGHPHAHHQELNNCSSSLWFYRWNVLVAVLLVVVGPVGRPAQPRPTALLLPTRSTVKPEAATAVGELLMMGVRTPETCWAVRKGQVMNLKNSYI